MDRATGDNVPPTNNFMGTMRKAIEDTKHNLVRDHQRQRLCADIRHHNIKFEVSEEVLSSRRNLHLKAPGVHKLLCR